VCEVEEANSDKNLQSTSKKSVSSDFSQKTEAKDPICLKPNFGHLKKTCFKPAFDQIIISN